MSELELVARDFVTAAFGVLRAENAIPTSKVHRHLKASLDFGSLPVQALPEYSSLSDEILAAAPPGLPDDSDLVGPAYTVRLLAFALLEMCVRCCSYADNYDTGNDEVTAAIAQFAAVVSSRPYDLVLCRVVSHLVPASGQEIEVDGITIVPGDLLDLEPRIVREIPDADHAWNRKAPDTSRPPHALLIVRRPVDGVNYHGHGTLSDRLDRFQLAVCLLKGANVQGLYQVSGAGSRVSARPADLELLIRNAEVPLVRRTARLAAADGPSLSALSELVEEVVAKTGGQGVWLSSFGEALEKFGTLDDTTSHFEQIVELATALEGVILGTNEGEGLTLRLCTRVTALLAHQDDPAMTLFDDFKLLYKFRSTIVHGGEMTAKRLRSDLRAMECVPAEDSEMSILGRVGFAVDRLRDIVRRAILARICLAAGDEPRWPLDGGKKPLNLDIILSDDSNRAVWRAHWRDLLESKGVGDAARRCSPPVYSLSEEDI